MKSDREWEVQIASIKSEMERRHPGADVKSQPVLGHPRPHGGVEIGIWLNGRGTILTIARDWSGALDDSDWDYIAEKLKA
ncbi:MAG: hypothetical protein Q7T86_03190 [Hyphomicrobiaceae bacterium]|nr:hypothetical protein [Hyphomicrobiaceae bacterium]